MKFSIDFFPALKYEKSNKHCKRIILKGNKEDLSIRKHNEECIYNEVGCDEVFNDEILTEEQHSLWQPFCI